MLSLPSDNWGGGTSCSFNICGTVLSMAAPSSRLVFPAGAVLYATRTCNRHPLLHRTVAAHSRAVSRIACPKNFTIFTQCTIINRHGETRTPVD